MRLHAGSLEDLKRERCLVVKAGPQPVCVVWHDDRAYAVDDRCPHMGFPLHRGTVRDGLLTCHWHHARFDLASGGTLDPFADDVRSYPVEVEDGQVMLIVEPEGDRRVHHRRRLEEGLEQGLTLVTAKAVLGLLEAGEPPSEVVRVGVVFGTTYRGSGWGAGLTVLVAMANLLPHLDLADRALALVHGLAFVSRDTRNRPPRFPLTPLDVNGVTGDRLRSWYRRFVETRSEDSAERALLTAIATAGLGGVGGDGPVGHRPAIGSASAGPAAPPGPEQHDVGAEPGGARRTPRLEAVARMMYAAATDHVFLDEGHTLDFTTKAFEALDHLGEDAAPVLLASLVGQTAGARRHEEEGAWRHPIDLADLIHETEDRLPALLAEGEGRQGSFEGVGDLGHSLLADDPHAVVDALCSAISAGATPEQLGRALAFAAALRITRFHVQNDHGDWDVVHHGFTHANALHQALARHPSPELLRGVVHGAMKVYLDRFLNVPPARLPQADSGELSDLQECWDRQGGVDRAGSIAYGYLRGGGDLSRLVAALGHALLAEDAQFHWFQTVEAAVRQSSCWPRSSEEAALILAATARFLAAHTPTRRELPQVVRIATRLRRGEALFEEA